MIVDIQSIPKLVISLPERGDRLEKLSKELTKLFFNPSYELIQGIRIDPVEVGIVQAHKNAIRHARENEWPAVIVLEDDLRLSDSPNLINYTTELFSNVPDSFGGLSGSCYCGNPNKYNEYWSLVKNFCGAQFVVYSSEYYDKIINHNFQNYNYDREVSKIIPFYVSNKLFATEYPGKSDHAKKEVNHDHLLKKYQLL
jgi:hypothetical protein